MKSLFLLIPLLSGLSLAGQAPSLESLYQELSQHPQSVALDYQPGAADSFSLDFGHPSLQLTCSGRLEKVRVLLLREPITTQAVLAKALLALGFQRVSTPGLPAPDPAMKVLGATTAAGQKQLCLLVKEAQGQRQWFISLTGDVQLEKTRS